MIPTQMERQAKLDTLKDWGLVRGLASGVS
jgi:hypothetical protein